MSATCASTPVIEMRRVERAFQTGDTAIMALQGIDLTIHAGEYVAIVGPSGSGKTTLMNLLGCLDAPSAGTYLLDGNAVEVLDDAALSHLRNKRIGFVFQSFHLLPKITALQNVALPLLYRGIRRAKRLDRAKAALDAVELVDRLEHLPNQLSGGQRQRVAIARALVGQPSLLLADEPTGALDQRTGHEVMDLFDRLNGQGTTLVVITHDATVAARARRQIRLVDGQIASDEVRS